MSDERFNTRRDILKKMVLSSPALLLSRQLLTGKSASSFLSEGYLLGEHVSMVESGVYRHDEIFVLGILVSMRSAASHESAIKTIRTGYNYKPKLTFGSTDKFKLKFASDLIDYFSNADDLVYYAQAFRTDITSMEQTEPPSSFAVINEKLQLYKSVLNTSLASGRAAPGPMEVHIKPASPFGPSGIFQNTFQKETGMQLKVIDARESELLQLNDILTGCVASEIRGGLRNKNKKQVVNMLKDSLSVSGLDRNMNRKNFKIRI